MKGLGFHDVFFKSDAKSVVDELSRLKDNATEIRVLLDDCRQTMSVEKNFSISKMKKKLSG